ncbi:RmlC-like cupin [Dichomitus squalens LYAD-421 SS1]|uniref:RmlC-like cupin n=1 Tax=Dichomitus squalens (strain LYAD-421) TaxID=732165 RepID=R7SP00_DICSQ|nr:RmlC-like cupin [Dichomitus squalens LYAD-421 SS1]EJF57653.1 RmlC-like cupin [Dichomitus squalens LYAD-421 SS1]
MAQWKPNTEPPETVCVIKNIAKLTSESDKFRRVMWTGRNSQLVIMTVPIGGEIGEERHTVDQHLNFLSGTGVAVIDGKREPVSPGDVVIVPAGALHNFKNTGPTPLILSTVYAPAEHKADTVHDTLEQGERLEEEGKDEPPSWAKDLHKKP